MSPHLSLRQLKTCLMTTCRHQQWVRSRVISLESTPSQLSVPQVPPKPLPQWAFVSGTPRADLSFWNSLKVGSWPRDLQGYPGS